MKTRLINLDGEILAAGKLFDTENRSFCYGDGLFESMKAVNGRVNFCFYHYERMLEAARAFQLELPAHFDFPFFKQQLEYLLQSNALPHARLRFTLFRQGAGRYLPESNACSYLAEAWEHVEGHYIYNESGLQTGLYTANYKSCTALSAWKSNNALLYILAAAYAREQQWDDCLIVNQKGMIAEASASNVFIVKDGKLITPARHQGCVMGVMRRVILAICAEQKIPCTESYITMDMLLEADELFLSNALRGIQWVASFAEKQYGNELSNRLHHLLLLQ